MLTFITGKHLLLASVIWPSLFIVTCFIMFYTVNLFYAENNDRIRQIPTFSETGSVSPTSIIFTLGLHVEAVLLCAVFLAIYFVYRERIDSFRHSETATNVDVESQSVVNKLSNTCCGCCFKRSLVVKTMHYWNYTLLILGLSCSFFMAMVGSITLRVNDTAHGTVAFIMFACAVLHLIIFYFKIAWFIETRPLRLIVYQLCLFMCIPFNLIVVIAVGSVSISCNSLACQSAFENTMSILEFITTIFLMVYIFHFSEDIACISLGHVIDPTLQTTHPLSPSSLNEQQQGVVQTAEKQKTVQDAVQDSALHNELYLGSSNPAVAK